MNNHHIFFLTYLSWDKLESGKVSVVRVVLLNKVTTLSLMTMTMVRMVAMVRMVRMVTMTMRTMVLVLYWYCHNHDVATCTI